MTLTDSERAMLDESMEKDPDLKALDEAYQRLGEQQKAVTRTVITIMMVDTKRLERGVRYDVTDSVCRILAVDTVLEVLQKLLDASETMDTAGIRATIAANMLTLIDNRETVTEHLTNMLRELVMNAPMRDDDARETT